MFIPKISESILRGVFFFSGTLRPSRVDQHGTADFPLDAPDAHTHAARRRALCFAHTHSRGFDDYTIFLQD